MNSENNINHPIPTPPPQTTAVNVYSDAIDDFPVLKAFQQYVDAEQAKAHKRLITVCVFFSFLMILIISVFMFIIIGLNNGNSGNDTALRAIAESNASIQRQMFEQASKMNEQLMRELSNKNNAPQTGSPSLLDAQIQKQNLDLQAKIHELEMEKRLALKEAADAKERAESGPMMTDQEKAELSAKLKNIEANQNARELKLKDREAKIAEATKLLKEKEIDLQRRKLYPNAFSNEARAKAEQEVADANRRSKEAEQKAREAEEKALAEINRIKAENRALEKKLLEMKKSEKKPKTEKPVKSITPIESEYGAKAVIQTDGTLRFFDDDETPAAKKSLGKKTPVNPDSDIDEIPDFPDDNQDGGNANPDADIDAIPDLSEYDIPLE